MADEIYIEMKRIGSIMKVNAIDAKTGIEVSIQGPANTSKAHLEKIAVNKLKFRLNQLKPSSYSWSEFILH